MSNPRPRADIAGRSATTVNVVGLRELQSESSSLSASGPATSSPKRRGARTVAARALLALLALASSAVVTAAAVAALPMQAVADRGPRVDITWRVDADRAKIHMAGSVIASRPCRYKRDFAISHVRNGTRVQDGSTVTNRAGNFAANLEFRYEHDNLPGDVPSGGGRITYRMRAPSTKPQRGTYRAYHCPRMVRTEVVDVPPDPNADL